MCFVAVDGLQNIRGSHSTPGLFTPTSFSPCFNNHPRNHHQRVRILKAAPWFHNVIWAKASAHRARQRDFKSAYVCAFYMPRRVHERRMERMELKKKKRKKNRTHSYEYFACLNCVRMSPQVSLLLLLFISRKINLHSDPEFSRCIGFLNSTGVDCLFFHLLQNHCVTSTHTVHIWFSFS